MLASLAATPAAAVDYRWVVGTGQGSVEASIRNKAGGNFIVFCGSGTDERRSGIILEGIADTASKGKPLDVQVVIDGKSFPFSVTDGYGPVAARGDRLMLQNLAQALSASRLAEFTIEYPSLDKSERYSLLSVRDALKEKKGTIVTPCL
ncbi:hypothetical protein [Methylobacterium haplocladii]|uniref:Uncharacterized protein n=1 Tax=Methylobacterium haplocladii TaxID=1176176 RepID=A0A512IJ40_9HYPH|nr:hypothetical protein [Methylobacterium haplocladii]GEO97648.1 hypothetical protein MHA02_00360 [Methylobacterium haplocladii]GLS57378.1 hypothetical protein GCM10007887_00330 [Methylobacterium haplocladii]